LTLVPSRGIHNIKAKNILVETFLRNTLAVFTSTTLAAQTELAPTPMVCGDHHGHFNGVVFRIDLDGIKLLGQRCVHARRSIAVCVPWLREGFAIPEIATNSQARFGLQAGVRFSIRHDTLLAIDACLSG